LVLCGGLIGLFAFIGSLGSNISAGAWQEYKSDAGRYRVQMPGRPTVESAPDTLGSLIMVHRATVVTNHGRRSFIVVHFDYPVGYLKQYSPKQLLDSARDAVITENKGRVLKEKEIIIEGYPGRDTDISVTSPGNGFLRIRHCLVGNRMYRMLIAVEPSLQDTLTGPDADKFFGSFALSNPKRN
jgi:hypothetical protein